MARGRGRGNPEDEDMEDINRPTEETSTIGRGSLSYHATHSHPDGTVYTPQHGASPSASHHDTPSPLVHALPAQHDTILSSSHHSTPSPPGYVYLHEHGIRPSSSHHATPSPSVHPAHSPGVGDEHTSTSRRLPAQHRTSSARSSTYRLRSSIPPAIEEIPDFFRPPTAPTEGENPLIHLIVEHGLLHPSSMAAGKMSLVFKSGYLKEGWKWEYAPQSQRDIYWLRCSSFGTCKCHLRYMMRGVGKQPFATNEAFKKKSEQMSTNRKSEVGGPGTGISLHSAGSISARKHGDTLEKKIKRRPTRKEMFRHHHTHGHDDQIFVDQSSAKIDAELTRRLMRCPPRPPTHRLTRMPFILRRCQKSRDVSTELSSQHIFRGSKLISTTSVRTLLVGRAPAGPPEVARNIAEGANGNTRTNAEGQDGTPRNKSRDAWTVKHSDDQPGHLTTDIAHSHSAHLDDHQPGHWTDPHREMPEDRHHLLDDYDEFMSQLMPPPQPPPRQ
ncbi:hypothetical protein Scep_024161 [Stephania cephalantha]|uniref:Uncharacterized protein n=1 Tax=Stephania cephalantha TaxID=152367 RepID=A0AAP0EW21_9MAGN